MPVGMVVDAQAFDCIGSVDVGAWIPHTYTDRTFVDASLTQYHAAHRSSLESHYIFCHEPQEQASRRRVNLPLRRILSKKNLEWYGNVIVLKTDGNGAIVDVAPADLPAINAAAYE